MLKKIILTILLLSFGSSLMASRFLIGVNGGSTSFDSGFDNAQEFGVHSVFASRSGMAIDASLSYFEADVKDSSSKITVVPALVGVSYIMGRGPVLPYIGAMGGLSLLGSNYNGTAVTYGVKGGLSFQVSPDFRLFIEGRKLIINEDSETIEPTTVSLGCSVIFGRGRGGKRPLPFMQRAPHGEEFKKGPKPKPGRRPGRRAPGRRIY